MKAINTIVVKVGTSTLTQGTKKLSRRYMLELARQLAEMHEKGMHVVLITSGAIAAGREHLKHPVVDRTLPSKQMFSAIGQVQLMQLWTDLFSVWDVPVGQLLLTRDDFSHRTRYLNVRDTLTCLLAHRVIPIINENDTIAIKETKVGDNDNLAALVANLIAADLLVLLTDQQGLYTADPRLNPDAELISVVKQIDDQVFALAGGSSTNLGTGGMTTKIQAAATASQCGIQTVIASSSHPNVLHEVVSGKSVGTCFQTSISHRESRKRWLLSEKGQGQILVDGGAAEKIMSNGASLLPSGVKEISQTFERGAIVRIMDLSGSPLAVGITNYSSHDIKRLIGIHSTGIENVLGYSYGPEIVHRNNMTRIKNAASE